MTTYTTITNAEIDQDSPVTQPLLTSLRDNPIAIAEGSTGAPRISGKALNTLYFRTSAGYSSNFSFGGLADFAAINFRGGCNADGGGVTRSLTAQLSDDNGATWTTAVTIGSAFISAKTLFNLDLSVNLLTGAYSTVAVGMILSGIPSEIEMFGGGTLNMPAGTVDAIRINTSAGMEIYVNVYGG